MRRVLSIIVIISMVSLPGVSQSFNLDSCKNHALNNNRKLKNAHLNKDASRQVKKSAFTNYFPKVDINAFAMKANKGILEAKTPEMNLPVYDGNKANLASPTQFTYVPGMNLDLIDYANVGTISAVQPIYAGGQIRTGNKLAGLGEDFSKLQLDLTKDEVLVTTEFYFWKIIALDEKKKTLNAYDTLLQNLKKDVEVSYNAGLIKKSDLLKVELELNNVKANKLKLNNGYELLNMTLAQHIGIEYSDNFKISESDFEVIPPDLILANHSEALENRSEYNMLKKAVEVERLKKKMAMGENLPKVAVGVQGLYLDIIENKSQKVMGFATVSIPISGWWGGSHKIKEQKLKEHIARNNLENNAELLMLQMDKAYKDLNESHKQISVAESSLLHAEEHMSVVTDNYNAGVVSLSDLLEAQALHMQSKDALVDAKSEYKIKQAQYLKTVAMLD